ncbi:MAG: CBS domain-containing protein [Chloroflexi bacterium]|nr:CBS domain-containing protein [Chloroflexota bacterium]
MASEGKLAREPRIGAIAHRDTPTCRLDQRLGDLHVSGDLCVVVNEQGVVLGDLRGKALHADPSKRVVDVMDPAPSTYRPNISTHEMEHAFIESGAKRVLVTDCDGRLVGWLARSDLARSDVEGALEAQPQSPAGPILASSPQLRR